MSVSSNVVRVLQRNLRRALKTGDLGDADDLLERLKQEDPLSVETRGLELECAVAGRRHDDAKALAVQLLDLFPGSARIHYLAGRLHYQTRNYPAALREFAESERIHPHWITQRWLGKTYTQTGQLAEAEAQLLTLVAEHPAVMRDLSWVYERMDDPVRALDTLERYLEARPDDEFAQAQRLRLRSQALAPEDLTAEVNALLDLGEDVDAEMLVTYIQRLLETGHGEAARRAVAEREKQLDARTAARIAWVCHRLRAFDLSMQLFLIALPEHLTDFKLLSALESAAAQCNRITEVIDRYEVLANDERRLYGRIKSLQRRQQTQ